MKSLKMVVWAVMGLALVGCKAPDLPERFIVTDESWKGTKPMPVGTGDVLLLTTWVNGVPVKAGVTSFDNGYPPLFATERFALRHAVHSLHPLESALLGSVLATHFSGEAFPDTALLTAALEAQKIKLWNAFVDSLQVQPPTATQSLELRLAPVTFCKNLVTDSKKTLATDSNASNEQRQLLLAAYFPGYNRDGKDAESICSGVTSTTDRLDLRRILPLPTSLAPIAEPRSNMGDGFYITGGGFVAVSRIEVEKHGVSLRTRDGMEARWSLAEWEESGVCRDTNGDLQILSIELGQAHHRVLDVISSSDYEIKVVLDEKEGRQVTQQPGTAGAGTISHDSLNLLFPNDISGIVWGRGDEPIAPLSPHSCSLD